MIPSIRGLYDHDKKRSVQIPSEVDIALLHGSRRNLMDTNEYVIPSFGHVANKRFQRETSS